MSRGKSIRLEAFIAGLLLLVSCTERSLTPEPWQSIPLPETTDSNDESGGESSGGLVIDRQYYIDCREVFWSDGPYEETPCEGAVGVSADDEFCLACLCFTHPKCISTCPEPLTGNARPVCDELNSFCFLDCSDGRVCPDGMECLEYNSHRTFPICAHATYWEDDPTWCGYNTPPSDENKP